jgi:predicted MPP superfamily phosphohydrolase
VALAIVFGLHFYFWARLVRDTALPAPWRQAATLALVGLALLLPVGAMLARSSGAGRLVAWPAFVWMGTMLLLLVALVGADLVRLAALLLRAAPDAERRLLLRRALAGAAATVAAGLAAFGTRNGLSPPVIAELELELARLPRALDGTTIVQITDLHVGPTIGRRHVEDLVARVNALDPDVVAITGDLVDGSVAELGHALAPIGELRARHGVYFVTGNHEYYAGVAEWLDELRRLGVRALRNERVSVGDGEHHFDLAGVDDWNARGMAPGHGHDLARALDGRDPSRELVLLAHQPRTIHEAARAGVGLQLSGHTHAGQIWPWGLFVRLQQPFVAGLVRVGATQLYVSPGTGYWGPPMRVGTRSEITRIVLRAAAA